MLDLMTLHAAGADVAGQNGDAWLRLPAVRNDRDGVLTRIREAHVRLGRGVLVCDLTGAPRPVAAGGEDAPRLPSGLTPKARELADARALTAEERDALVLAISRFPHRDAYARSIPCPDSTVSAALRGRVLLPATRARVLSGTTRSTTPTPDGDSDPAAPADAPASPQSGAAPERATIPNPSQDPPMPPPRTPRAKATKQRKPAKPTATTSTPDAARKAVLGLAATFGLPVVTVYVTRDKAVHEALAVIVGSGR